MKPAIFYILAFWGILFCTHLEAGTKPPATVCIEVTSGCELIYDKSYALILESVEYKKRSWPKLTSIPEDTRDLKLALADQGFEVQVVSDKSRNDYMKILDEWIKSHTGEHTRLLVYIMGHGWTKKSLGYLVMYDAPSEFDATFNDHLVSLEEIKTIASHAHAKHVLFAFDSCFSGYVLSKAGGRVQPMPPEPPSYAYFKALSMPNVEFLTASGANQRTDALSHFTPNFIAGIEGLADENSRKIGFVPANQLWNFIDRQMANVANRPEFGYLEGPGGDMVFKYPSDHQAVPITSLRFVTSKDREFFDPDVPIVYFRHLPDGPFVEDALNATGLHYIARGSLAAKAVPANSVACSPKSPMETVRTIALAMLERGVPLKYILRVSPDLHLPADMIQVMGIRGKGTAAAPILTRKQIVSLKDCPSLMYRSKSNSFEGSGI